MNQSLDDIIKKNKGPRFIQRGRVSRGNPRQGQGGKQPNRGGARGGMVSKRGGISSRGRVTDARLKIIQKKRQGITDARDQLAQLAKRTDARDKLNTLRFSRGTSRSNTGFKRVNPVDARAKLNSRKNWPSRARSSGGRGATRMGGFSVNKAGISRSSQLDVDLMYEEEEEEGDYMDLIREHARTLPQRTFNNTASQHPFGLRGLAPNKLAISPALLRIKVPMAEADYGESYYDEDIEDELMDVDLAPVRTRPVAAVPQRSQAVRSAPLSPLKRVPAQSSGYNKLRSDWVNMPKSSTMRGSMLESGSDIVPPARQMQSRLDSGFNQPARSSGFKVVVSNLQNGVTEDDIKELFGDIGPLIQWRLIRPGTAEVTYKQQSHAAKAVDVYHKRQLDGQSMNVILVSSVPQNPRIPPSGKMLGHRSSVQPDLGIIHKALFK